MVGVVTRITARGPRSAYGENDFHFQAAIKGFQMTRDLWSSFRVLRLACSAYLFRNWDSELHGPATYRRLPGWFQIRAEQSLRGLVSQSRAQIQRK